MLTQKVELHWLGVVGPEVDLAANEITVANGPVQAPDLLQGAGFYEFPKLEVRAGILRWVYLWRRVVRFFERLLDLWTVLNERFSPPLAYMTS